MSKKLLFNFNREVIQNYTYVKYVGATITATNTLEKPIKSAILKGSTKYRDIDTGEFLETFEEGRNLELVSVKMPVLTTSNGDGTKTNILTTPKEVVLRSLPNGVCDTLNVETGEYIQRIGEVVFDGNANENWTLNTIHDMNDTYAKFILRNVPNDMLLKNSLSHWIANRFKNQLRVGGVPNEEGISSEGSKQVPLMITIKRDKLTESTPEGFKRWLVQNPVTVQYELATPIIKTVDLSILDQNENKVSSISSFNDTTHITASSETIPPIFEGYLATKEVE